MHEPNEFGVPTHAHSHTEAHSHSHPHVHESKKNVVNRLARAIGHLEKVKRMVEDDCDCAEVLILCSYNRQHVCTEKGESYGHHNRQRIWKRRP